MVIYAIIDVKISCALLAIAVLGFAPGADAAAREDVSRLELEAPAGLTRAELWHGPMPENVRGALVLCPGVNGSGEGLARDEGWRRWADGRGLLLVGLSFASPVEDLKAGKGYYYASQGSGAALLEGLERLGVPLEPDGTVRIFLMGFSGGAHFTSRFAEWKPEAVAAWCAYSAAWWDEVRASAKPREYPPGLIVCGQDDPRYSASQVFFYQGRAAGRPWMWLSLKGNAHSWDSRVSEFACAYFSACWEGGGRGGLPTRSVQVGREPGGWVDVDRKKPITSPKEAGRVIDTGWLPDKSLFGGWSALHEP